MARQVDDGEQIVVGIAPVKGQPPVLGSSVSLRLGRPGPAGHARHPGVRTNPDGRRGGQPEHRDRAAVGRPARGRAGDGGRHRGLAAMPTASSPASTSSPRSTASARRVWKSCARWSVSKTGAAPIRRRRRDGAARCASGAGRVDQLGGHRGGNLCGRSAVSSGRCARRAVCSAFCCGAPAHRSPRMRAIGVGLVAVGVVGAGFGFAIALRANAVARHPIAAAFGTAAQVTVTPTESALSVGRGRLMFRATLQQLGNDEISGRVVVFAPARDFSAGDGRSADALPRQNRSPHPPRPDGGGGQRDRGADDGSRRAGAPGCARGPRGVRCRSSSSAARRPGGDAARAGARRHVDGHPDDQPRIPRGRIDAPHRGFRGQCHDRVRSGAVLVAADRAAGGGGAGRCRPGAVRHRGAAHGQRAARGGDGRDRAGGCVVVAAAASDSGSCRPPCWC